MEVERLLNGENKPSKVYIEVNRLTYKLFFSGLDVIFSIINLIIGKEFYRI